MFFLRLERLFCLVGQMLEPALFGGSGATFRAWWPCARFSVLAAAAAAAVAAAAAAAAAAWGLRANPLRRSLAHFSKNPGRNKNQ